MKLSKAFLALAATAVAGAALAGQAPTKATFQKLYNQYGELIMKKDVGGLEKFMRGNRTNDFVSIDVKKKRVDNDFDIKQMKNVMGIVSKFNKMSTTVLKVTGNKNSATVTAKTFMSATTLLDKNSKGHVIETTDLSTDVWVRVNGKWKDKSSTTVTNHTTMDGETIPSG